MPGAVHLWDVDSGKRVRTLKTATGVKCLAYAPDGKTLVAGTTDRKVVLWDADSGAVRAPLTMLGGEAEALAFSPNGRHLACGGGWGFGCSTVTLLDTSSGEQRQLPPGDGTTTYVTCLGFSPDGRVMAVGGDQRGGPAKVYLWELRTGRPLGTLTFARPVTCLTFAPDGKIVATGGWGDGQPTPVRLWHVSQFLARQDDQ